MVRWWCGAISLLATGLPGLGCSSNAFECTAVSQCNGDAADALCQPTGYCSFPDEQCPSGQRYGALAGGGLANACVEPQSAGTESTSSPPPPATSGGSTSTTTSTTNPVLDSSTGPGPQDTTDTPPVCGGADQPCCDGSCDPRLSCVEGLCQGCTVHIDVDETYSCGRQSDGTVACWGSDDFGQLGDGRQAHPGGSPEPVSVTDLLADQLSLGAFHACAVGPDGLWCWGRNDLGQLGQGLLSPPIPSPVFVDIRGIDQVNCGSFHCCAHDIDDGVWCWGENDQGQIGQAMVGIYPVPQLTPFGGFESVATGARHSCALASDGQVGCWGLNNDLQLGVDANISAGQFVLTKGIPAARALTVGDFHTCIITARTDEVWCWGRNNFQQTGTDSSGADVLPHPVPIPGPVSTIDAGDDHTCAITEGQTYCWGNNSAGQLGSKGIVSSPDPLPVAAPGTVTQVAAGREHTCIVIDGVQIQCFGLNLSGQLGDGTTITSPLPVDALFACSP